MVVPVAQVLCFLERSVALVAFRVVVTGLWLFGFALALAFVLAACAVLAGSFAMRFCDGFVVEFGKIKIEGLLMQCF